MITNEVERKVGLRNTLEFIKANETKVLLLRPDTKLTEAGGVVRTEPSLLPAQSFRIVPMSGLVWDRSRTTPDEGRIDDVTEQLIGMPDADVLKNDYFEAEDQTGWYQVTHISPVQGYRKEARLRFSTSEPKA